MLEALPFSIILFFVGGIGFYLAKRSRETGVVPQLTRYPISKKKEPVGYEYFTRRYEGLGWFGLIFGFITLLIVIYA